MDAVTRMWVLEVLWGTWRPSDDLQHCHPFDAFLSLHCGCQTQAPQLSLNPCSMLWDLFHLMEVDKAVKWLERGQFVGGVNPHRTLTCVPSTAFSSRGDSRIPS